MTNLLQDLRFAVRILARAPGFALITIAVLGLGTGAATAIFSVLDGVVFKPLPYAEPDRLVTLWAGNQEKGLGHEPVSPVNFVDYRGLDQVFADAAAWWRPEFALTQPGLEPMRVDAVETSGNLFALLGVQPELGAGFPADGPLHAAVAEVVLSHRLWQTRFAGDRNLIGHNVTLDGRAFTVVGVMPAGFSFPGHTDVWQRLSWDLVRHNRGAHFMEAVARLAPGVDLEHANLELAALGRRLAAEHPETNAGWQARATPLGDEVVGYFRPALLVLMAAVALLLAIACVNVANLLLARATSRAREMAVRSAIGASRARLVGQLLAESLVLAVGGSLAGLAVATIAVRLLVAAPPIPIPRLDQVAIDARVFAFTAGVATLVAFAVGLFPALLLTRSDLQQTLREGGRGGGASARARRLRHALVVGEVALSVALLGAAGLILQTVRRLAAEDPGVEPAHVLTCSLQLPAASYPQWDQVSAFYEGLADDLRRQPGIAAVGSSNFLPLDAGWRIPLGIEGKPPEAPGDEPQPQYHTVGTGYFAALGIPLVDGRLLDHHDDLASPGVVLVNRAAARRFWPAGGAVGAQVHALTKHIGPLGIRLADSDLYEVVGIVGDVKNGALARDAEPAVYFSQTQFPFREMFLEVRGHGTPESLLATVRNAVRSRDPALPLSQIASLDQVLGEAVARPRFLTGLMSTFAALALLLAAIGLHGVLAYAVAERRREIGVRIALGARAQSVAWMVARQGLALTAFGVTLGLGAAYLGGRSLAMLLADVRVADPATFALDVGTVVTVAAVASYLPALRAARLDPLEALREP